VTPFWQISRNGAFWLLAAFLVSCLSLVQYLPTLILAVVAVSLLWRIGIYRGRWGAPGRWLKLLLMIACGIGIQLSFSRIYGLEPMVTLLVCGYSLKLLEMHQRRDALVVIFLGYFVAITLALFDQGIATALIILVSLILITASLAALHGTSGSRVRTVALWRSARLLAQAFPLMLVFFLVMPRLPPLWSVPAANSSVTGMSDNLRIGDITRLGTSGALAFRVDFDGQPPPRQQLYWRGMTLSGFDGQSWTRSGWGYRGGLVNWQQEPEAEWQRQIEKGDAQISYRIMLERQGGNWLYSLWLPEPGTPGTGLARDMTLVSAAPAGGRSEYRVISYPEARAEVNALDHVRRRFELHLPGNGNPQTRRLAAQWAGETGSADKLIQRLMAFYNQEFSYTLQPPALGENAVDDFLFSSRQGFCEHFAASFVFFMRAAGIPARLVVGYQGGEFHPDKGYLTVRQYDAHAWAEVWLEGRGWVQYDPTAAVAPERILSSFLDLMSEEVVFEDSPFSIGRYRGIDWLNQLRLNLDDLEYRWARWILGYDNIQESFLARLLGGFDSWRLALFVLLASSLALLPVLGWSLFSRRGETHHPLDALYLQFCQRLATAGCERQPGEGPQAFARRSAEHLPGHRQRIDRITQGYVNLRYRGQGDLAKLKQEVRQFRPAIQSLWRKPVTTQICTLAGGCFWCLDSAYRNVKGVVGVTSGYTGGQTENPTYRQICTGMTGHAEVVQLEFNPDKISFREVLEIFFALHDPTSLNRQGADVGTQYRSAIFYHDQHQKQVAEEVIADINQSGLWDSAVVTALEPLTVFYPAEDYHQDYYAKEPESRYCQLVISPKLAKFRENFRSKLK
jgi:protein-glutamine gamma-glutamyltransferase